MNRRMDLTGARVWITGASSGIGEAIIGPLVGRGARIAISARRAERLAAIAGNGRRAAKTSAPFRST